MRSERVKERIAIRFILALSLRTGGPISLRIGGPISLSNYVQKNINC